MVSGGIRRVLHRAYLFDTVLEVTGGISSMPVRTGNAVLKNALSWRG